MSRRSIGLFCVPGTGLGAEGTMRLGSCDGNPLGTVTLMLRTVRGSRQSRGEVPGGVAYSAEIQQMHGHSSAKGKSVGLREMKATCRLLKSGVGGKPGELDSEKIRAYGSISYFIFGEGLGIPPSRLVPQTSTLVITYNKTDEQKLTGIQNANPIF